MVAYGVPFIWLVSQNVALVASQAEYIGYRFFTGLEVLAGQPEKILIVQGIPMAVAQNGLVWLLTGVLGLSPTRVATLNVFGTVSLGLAFGLGVTAIAAVWVWRGLSLGARLVLTAAPLAVIYAWPTLPMFLAPDYWIFEIPYALLSATWCVYVLQGRANLPHYRLRQFVYAGVWLALGATLKISLVALGLLPLIAYGLLVRGLDREFLIRGAALTVVTAVLCSVLLVFVYFLGNVGATVQTLQTFTTFIQDPGGAEFQGLSDALTSPRSEQIRVTLLSSGLAVVLGLAYAVSSAEPRRIRARLVVMMLIVVALSIGHIYAIWKRPTTTSTVDFAIYALFAIPIVTSLRARTDLAWLIGALIMLVPFGYMAQLYQPWRLLSPSVVAAYRHSSDVIEEVQAYEAEVNRPIVLFLPNNAWTGTVMEQIGLYYGRLWFFTPDVPSIRTQIFPRTYMLLDTPADQAELQRRFAQGDLVIWAHAQGLPEPQVAFPVLKPFYEDPRTVLRTWQHRATGERTIFVAYLKT